MELTGHITARSSVILTGAYGGRVGIKTMAKQSQTKLNSKGNRRGMSPSSRENLAKGRKPNLRTKKDYSITRIIKEMLDQPAQERWLEVDDKGQKLTWRQAIAKRILIEAVKGNQRLIPELLDRLEGKVSQPIETPPDKPLAVKIIKIVEV